MLSMCGGYLPTGYLATESGYLATESSHDTSCCVGSLNKSGITVKECSGHSGLKLQYSQQTYHGACGLKSSVQGCVLWLDQSEFRCIAEVSLPVLISLENTKRKETSASREIKAEP